MLEEQIKVLEQVSFDDRIQVITDPIFIKL